MASAIQEIISAIAARKVALRNPVISEAVATMLCKLSTTNFDPEAGDIETVFAALPKRFRINALSRAAWSIDISIVNDLRLANRTLIIAGFEFDAESRTESFNSLYQHLYQQWDSEANSYEVGYEDSGVLHRLAASLNIRQAYHDNAQLAFTGEQRVYTVKSLDAQLGNPTKQTIHRNQLANFRMEALVKGELESDIEARTQFDQGIIWSNDLDAKSKIVENVEGKKGESKTSPGQLAPQQYMTIDLPALKDDIVRLSTNLAGLRSDVLEALEVYFKFVTDKTTELEGYYQRELDAIPVMMEILRFVTSKVEDDKLPFSKLPVALQVHVLKHIDQSMDQTMKALTSAPTETYSDYRKAVGILKDWFNLAIAERLENDKGYVEPELTDEDIAAGVTRSELRRRDFRKLED